MTRPPAAGPPRFLIVDDEPDMRFVVRKWLTRAYAGVEVHEAEDAERALEWLADAPPGPLVVVSDYRMPGMDGIELLGHVRERRPDARRVLLTAFTREELGPRFDDEIVDALVEKGVRADELLAALARVVAATPREA